MVFFTLGLESVLMFELFSLIEVGQSAITLKELLNHPKYVEVSHVPKSSLELDQISPCDLIPSIHKSKADIKEDQATTHRH